MTTKRDFDIIKAINDPNIFGLWFRDKDTWQSWFAFLQALFALPMDPPPSKFTASTPAGRIPRHTPATEAWLVVAAEAAKAS